MLWSARRRVSRRARCYTTVWRLGEALIRTTRVILHGRIVRQLVDRDETSAFRKEIVVTGSRVPLAMVRKRAADGRGDARARAPRPRLRPESLRLASAGAELRELPRRGRVRRLQPRPSRSRPVASFRGASLSRGGGLCARGPPGRGGRGAGPLRGPNVWVVGHSLGGLVAYASAPTLAGADRAASPRSAARITSRAAR